jgi:site-specific recombinase XerD
VKRRVALPPFAETYLKQSTRRHTERVVVLFHRWLARTGLSLAAVRGEGLESFSSGPRGRPVAQMTRNNYRYELRLYLRWLERRGLAGPFEASELEGYHRKLLPDELRRFLRFLAPTHRPSTVHTYRSALLRFHVWFAAREGGGPTNGADEIGAPDGRAPLAIDRGVCLAWAQQLHADALHPATRVGMLVCLRKYLDWLYDQRLVAEPGWELIVVGDLPKKPEYLPRPLPPEADLKLQARLKGADSDIALGLYVMRRTGLRIGELRQLELHCVREDHAGNSFLKVPLGKLQKERLVPLDPTTLAVIRTLQEQPHRKSPWLFEGARARPVSAATFRSTLVSLAGDLQLQEPLVPHRLRHTYATSLMNGGMSLLGIMKLLGHRDQRMTLRYTQIADETVGREYFEAIARIAERYQLPQPTAEDQAPPDATALLDDAIRWVTKNLCDGALDRRARLLIRRLEAARKEVLSLSSPDDR